MFSSTGPLYRSPAAQSAGAPASDILYSDDAARRLKRFNARFDPPPHTPSSPPLGRYPSVTKSACTALSETAGFGSPIGVLFPNKAKRAVRASRSVDAAHGQRISCLMNENFKD